MEPGVEIQEITMTFYEKNGNIRSITEKWEEMNEREGFKQFLGERYEPSHRFQSNRLRFDLFIVDTNKEKQKVYSGIFTDNKNDNQ